MEHNTLKPFLRWAGGKKWLLKDINDFIPSDGFAQYHEPFIGGGAVYFYLNPQKAFISDINKPLIETYQSLRNNVSDVINILSSFENSKEEYYKLRSKAFTKKSKRAAQFIYLNKTSFNGIYRVNLKGEYNVPYGYKPNYVIEIEKYIAISKRLKKASISCCDFMHSIENVKKGDLVFLDPPYTVTHNNNGFIKYNSKLFNEDSQIRLSNYIDMVDKKGATYILTNAAHKWVQNLFTRENNRIFKKSRVSLVGGKNAKRGAYEEFVITNTKF